MITLTISIDTHKPINNQPAVFVSMLLTFGEDDRQPGIDLGNTLYDLVKNVVEEATGKAMDESEHPLQEVR